MAAVTAFRDDALGHRDAWELRQLLRSGELHPSELVDAAIARAELVQPQLNAIARARFESARADAQRPRGGLLAGLPYFIKDTDPVLGMPLGFGSRGMPDEPSTKDSRYVAQMRDLGLVLLGKTTTPEFGLTATTEAILYGPTRNPWSLEHSTGGSSGGSAALVAAGVVPIAHANDGGGSIRIPASCCGVVGLKPSRGRLPSVEGAAVMPIKLVEQGVVSRSVRDSAMFYHAAEEHTPSSRLPQIGLVEGPGPRRRIAFFTGWLEGQETHADCLVAVRRVAEQLDAAGHEVVEIACPFDWQLAEDFLLLWSTMAFGIVEGGRALIHPRFDKTKTEAFTRALAERFRTNLRKVPGAMRRLRRFESLYAAQFEKVDLLLSPTVATPPPRLGYLGPEVHPDVLMERLEGFVSFTTLQNLAGAPAISLPAGSSTEGLPIGIQLAAATGDERMLLEVAFEYEQIAPWPSVGQLRPALVGAW